MVPGSFEVSRLRELFAEQLEPAEHADATEEASVDGESRNGAPRAALHLPQGYEATTVGGLVSEIAGHIPLPGEVIEEDGLRLEVLASTDRKVERLRLRLADVAAE